MKRKTWKEFQSSKLLWWVNRSLHLFGWAIVLQCEEDGEVTDAYPARVDFRGFSEKDEGDGFRGLTLHIAENAAALVDEALLPPGPPPEPYLVLHTHRHGFSHYLVESASEPSEEDALAALPELRDNYESDREDESIEIIRLGGVDARITGHQLERQ